MEVMPHSHIERGSQVYNCLYETEPGQILARPNLEMTTKLNMQSPSPGHSLDQFGMNLNLLPKPGSPNTVQ